MMNYSFQREVVGDTTRLILSIDNGIELDQFALKMISHNEIEHFVPMQLTQYNNANFLQYDITGLGILGNMIAVVLNKKEVVQILDSIINAFEETEEYMLTGDNLLLDINYIFVDRNNKCRFLYLPFDGENSVDKITFLQTVVEQIQPNYSERDPYIFNILNAFSRGAVKKNADLKEILHKINTEALPTNNDLRASENEIQGIQKQNQANGQELQLQINKQNTKEIELNSNNEQKKTNENAKEKVRPTNITFNIPGRENASISIPEEKKQIVKKCEEKNKKKEEKKRLGVKFWGKEDSNKAEESITKPDFNKEEKHYYNKNDEMYESYQQTVFMTQPQISAVDNDATICIQSSSLSAELIRKETGERIQIVGDNIALGSGNTVDCQIAGNKAISRKHATINVRDGIFCITDNNSSNGTRVNGTRLVPEMPVEIYDNTLIRLANEDFIFKLR